VGRREVGGAGQLCAGRSFPSNIFLPKINRS
jgi:hypothetical protein